MSKILDEIKETYLSTRKEWYQEIYNHIESLKEFARKAIEAIETVPYVELCECHSCAITKSDLYKKVKAEVGNENTTD